MAERGWFQCEEGADGDARCGHIVHVCAKMRQRMRGVDEKLGAGADGSVLWMLFTLLLACGEAVRALRNVHHENWSREKSQSVVGHRARLVMSQ